ncbi:MAG: ABC transporter permease [Candidatus Aminicenantes bacterium]|nr:ABC transporter permease [Candidatus Aminicenantes bacterium]
MILKIAFRNVFRQRRRTILTALSMFGGFVLSTFFIGWSDGTYNNIIDTFTRYSLGHIQVHEKDYLDRPSLYKTVNNLPQLEKILQDTEKVDSWTPRLFGAGLVSVKDKSAGTRIIGIDPQKEVKTTKFDEKIIEGRMLSGPAHEALLGKGLAKILKAGLDDEIVVLSQGADGSIANDLYKIVGIVDSGDEIGDRASFYLHLQDAQELLVLEGRVHEIAITTASLNHVSRVSEALREKIADPGLEVAPWQVFARSFYVAMNADKEGMWIMLVIIIMVVAVGVLNTVLMSVLERRREYGVLKAVGTKPAQIVKMVLTEVNILAVICIICGAGVGLLLLYIFSIHGYSLPEPITYGGMKFQHMMAEINARSFYIPAVTVLLVSTLVSLVPAFKAARTDPAKSMRTH